MKAVRSNSGYILEVKPTNFAYELDEEMRERGVKNDSKVSALKKKNEAAI